MAAAVLSKTARYKQSICWQFFIDKVKAERLVSGAAAIGYAGFDYAPQESWPLILDHGLRVAAIRGHISATEGLNHRENHDRLEDELGSNIELAGRNDIPVVICFSGNRAGLSDEEGIENTAEGLRRVAKAAERNHVTLCMEMINSKINRPDYHADRTWWAVEACKRVGSPAVKVAYDFYHMQTQEGDMIATIRQNIAHIGHIHTGGVPGRNELDGTQEINYPAVMRAIAATGYAGYVGHEFTPRGNPLRALRQAFKVCDV